MTTAGNTLRIEVYAVGEIVCHHLHIATINWAAPYLKNSKGWPSSNVTYRFHSNMTDSWKTAVRDGVSLWNSSGAGVTITEKTATASDPGSQNIIGLYYDKNTDVLAYYDPSYFLGVGKVVSFNIVINDALLTAGLNKAKGTVAHEFGHVFWLDDNPETPFPTIMDYRDFAGSIYTPQASDIDNVYVKYKYGV